MKNNKPDDYVSNGVVEAARFGNVIHMRSQLDSDANEDYKQILLNHYPTVVAEINSLIKKMREKITSCSALPLLIVAADSSLMTASLHSSEFEINGDEVPRARLAEYIQSVYASSAVMPFVDESTDRNYDPSLDLFEIQALFEEVYNKLPLFYLSFSAQLEERYPQYSNDIKMQIIESQMMFNVRGNQYQFTTGIYFEKLLLAQDDNFKLIYGMSSLEVINGIKKIIYALSQGRADSFNTIIKIFNPLSREGCDNHSEEFISKAVQAFEGAFGSNQRSIRSITEWPSAFIKDLSYDIGEETEFFNRSQFSGWPIIELPIQKRPFLEIEGEYYCFDYYSFVDNIYRAIQKAVTSRIDPIAWSSKQQVASEHLVEEIFQELLPGCSTYLDNYYPTGSSLKNMAENDLLVKYGSTLLIVEVKAGSFVYTAPMTDFEAHVRSYKTLLEKADHQCMRTYDYLNREAKASIYDSKRKQKTVINMEEITEVYNISITVDNINSFAAKADKLNFLELQSGAISLSIDDLMVYSEYFDSPLVFLHFLKHRKLATKHRNIALNDELDHLGMYLEHNYYSMTADSFSKDSIVSFQGYRQDLDNYFNSLVHPEINISKPSQGIPHIFEEILDQLILDQVEQMEVLSNYLLDFSQDAKEELSKNIYYLLERQKVTGHMSPMHSVGRTDQGLRYDVFISQPGIKLMSEQEMIDYSMGSLIRNSEIDRMMICLGFNSNKLLQSVSFEFFKYDNVPEADFDRLIEIGEAHARRRLSTYVKSHPGKIGRNSPCPCMSGKKYKKCCGR
uniref:YecA/YgfB family protein n=1 Tax=Enterococcus faecalis TaxID=1351 RepID=UPI00359C5A21